MAKFDIKTVKPKFVVTTSPDNKIDVVVNKPIITSKNTKSFFQLKNTGGPKGEKGDKGDAATITVASTTTGAAGTDASVVNQGTAQDAQLAFTIPRGDKGDTGATGPAGYSPKAKVEKTGHDAVITIQDQSGTTTATVSDGQDGQDGQAATIAVDSTTTLPAGSSATVTNVGTSSAASLAFGIPKGDTGADGEAATIQVGQVETLQPDQQAYVTNVGTSEAAIFNIGIPKGEKGESGSGSGDMVAADYDPNSTVKNAGGIPDYVSSQLPGDMTGATSSAAGAHGLVPAPAAGDEDKVLKGDGTWGEVAGSEVILYVNKSQYDLNITGGSAAFAIYTDSSYTTAATLSTITDATSAGQTVTIKTNDSCEMKVLGDLGTGGYQETYFSAVLAENRGVGKLTYRGSSSDWVFNPGAVVATPNDATLTIQHNGTNVQTFTANSSANKTANIETIYATTVAPASTVAPITTAMVQDGAITYDKLDWSTIFETYTLTNLPVPPAGSHEYKLFRNGKVCTLEGRIMTDGYTSANTFVNIGTLPDAIRPSERIESTAIMANSNTGNIIGYGRVRVSSAGTVSVQIGSATSSSCGFVFNVSWYI